jgi:hypothetical protein
MIGGEMWRKREMGIGGRGKRERGETKEGI